MPERPSTPAAETFAGLGALPTAIPRHLYQCVARKDALRDEYVDNIAAMKRINPGYGFTLFDDDDILDFVRDHYGHGYVDRFAAISSGYGAAKADFFRYLLIYQTGGIYLDIKSTTDRPLDEMLLPEDRFILCQWNNQTPSSPYYKWGCYPELAALPGGEYQQWHVIATAGHPFLEAVIARMLDRIDRYTPWRMGFGHAGVVRTTGPVMYTQAIEPIRHLHSHRLVRDNAAMGLRYSMLPGVHDHRQGGGEHYVANYRPIFQMNGWRAPMGKAYLETRRTVDRMVRQPLRRVLGRT